MSFERVEQYFLEKNIENPVFKLDDSIATVEMAARAIGVDAKLIAKTLAFRIKDETILVVARGDARIDNKKFKQHFKVKAKMIDHNEVEIITGHPVGGLCPFGLKEPLDIYIDTSIKDFEHVYPAAGSKVHAVKISPTMMHEITDATWVDICTELDV